jgi:hypothetical protein
MDILHNLFNYFISYEFILTYGVMIGSVYNIIHNYKDCESIPYGIILLCSYLVLSSHSIEFKKLFIVIYIFFSVSTYFGEEMIIKKTNQQAIQYKNCPKNRTAPPWLFTAYLTMLLNILVIFEIYWSVILRKELPFY